MDGDVITWLIVGALAGGFINGLAGFGTSLFALGFWLLVLPPVSAVAISLVMSVASGVQGVYVVRRSINRYRLSLFVVPALFGVPFGLIILKALNPSALKLAIAGFLILYGAFFLVRRNLPTIGRVHASLDAGVGFVGGLLGGATGLSGALPTMWLAMRDWSKDEQRAVLQPFNVIILSCAIVLFALDGAFTRDTLFNIALALPATMIASQIGLSLFKRLSTDQFRWLLVSLLFVSGLIQLGRELIIW